MHLYKISQDDVCDYDTYDSAIVVAETAEEATLIDPSNDNFKGRSWTKCPNLVTAEYIGEAAAGLKAGTIILSSFNAG
jgi:hypothetical protein